MKTLHCLKKSQDECVLVLSNHIKQSRPNYPAPPVIDPRYPFDIDLSHGNPNMSSCFRCTVGYPNFRIQTMISVIYSPKDNIYWVRVILAQTRKTAFANFLVYQRDVLAWGDGLKKRRFLNLLFFR